MRGERGTRREILRRAAAANKSAAALTRNDKVKAMRGERGPCEEKADPSHRIAVDSGSG